MKKLLIMSMLISAVSLVLADEPEADIEGTNSEAQKPQALAEKFGISVDSVNALKTNFKIGYGGVKHALSLASQTELTVEEILTMKTEGKMGWGNIRKELGVVEGKVSNRERKLDRQEKLQRKMDKMATKAEKRQNRVKGKK